MPRAQRFPRRCRSTSGANTSSALAIRRDRTVGMPARAASRDVREPPSQQVEIGRVAAASHELLERGRDRRQPVEARPALARALLREIARDACRLDDAAGVARQRDDGARSERRLRVGRGFDSRAVRRRASCRRHPRAEVAADQVRLRVAVTPSAWLEQVGERQAELDLVDTGSADGAGQGHERRARARRTCPPLRNQSSPKRAISARCASVSTFRTSGRRAVDAALGTGVAAWTSAAQARRSATGRARSPRPTMNRSGTAAARISTSIRERRSASASREPAPVTSRRRGD